MGVSGIGVWQVLILLLIVLLIFGTKRLRNIGSDLGGALRGFRRSLSEDNDAKLEADPPHEEDAKAAKDDQKSGS